MISYFLNDRAKANGLRNFSRTGSSYGERIAEIHLLQLAGVRFSWFKALSDHETLVRIK